MVLPSIVYPLPLHNYSLPCELGSFIFWNTFTHARLTLDCDTIGIPNREKLLNLCNYQDAVEYIITKGLAKKPNPLHSGSDSDREESSEYELPVVTMSAMQLCRKLKSVNHRFSFEFINEVDVNDEECIDKAECAEISPVKVQRMFVEDMIHDICEHQQ